MLCNQGPADIDVQLDYNTPQENTSLTAAQIDAKFKDDAESTLAMDRKGPYVGTTKSPLTQGHLDVLVGELDNKSRSFQARMLVSTACPLVKKITYIITYKPEVYIASDLRNEACSHGVTVMHTKLYIDAYLQSINEYIPRIKKGIEDYVANMAPQQWISPAVVSVRQHIIKTDTEKAINDLLDPVLKQIEETSLPRLAAINTPESYARDSALCPGMHPEFPEQ